MKKIITAIVLTLVLALGMFGCNNAPKHDCNAEGHVFIRYTYDDNATCEQNGTQTSKCEHCNETKTVEKEGTKEPNCSYVNGVCKWCSRQEPSPHVCVYNMETYTIVDGNVYVQNKCSCGEKTGTPTLTEGFTIVTPETAQDTLNALTDNAKIIFSSGNYSNDLFIGANGEQFVYYENITIVGTDDAYIKRIATIASEEVNIEIDGITFKNLTLKGKIICDGIYFKGWSGMLSAFKNVNVLGCSFVDIYSQFRADNYSNGENANHDGEYVIENLKLENCVFKGINSSLASSVAINGVENLTVTGCLFEDIDYDVLQINHRLGGTVIIKNNHFKDYGARLFNFNAYLANELYDVTVDISYNYIYDITPNCVYKYGKCPYTTTELTLGVNYWQTIPEISETYFQNIKFTPSEQIRF